MTVKNVGKGKSFETQANLRNLTGDGLLLHAGRFDVSNMKPGDVEGVAFTFDVLDELARQRRQRRAQRCRSRSARGSSEKVEAAA